MLMTKPAMSGGRERRRRRFLLHQFMTDHRAEILERCIGKLKQEMPERAEEELEQGVATFLDEVLRALQRDSGVLVSSPLPEASETAARLGEARQRAGHGVTKVPEIFAAISSAVGAIGKDHALSITAEEYQAFNRCLDTGVATSIENYWKRERADEDARLAERVGFLAHELRNALGSAVMAFKALKNSDAAMQGVSADVLARSLLRMEALVTRALGDVQLEVGITPELRPVNVSAVIRDLQASAVTERDIAISLDVDPCLTVLADEVLLASAISNLLQNAIKYTKAAGRVTLRTRSDVANVVIEIQDECGGLPLGNPEELFAPYVKRGGHRQSVGLGLSICRRAARAQGGELGVRNLPGQGCVFFLQLPRHAGVPVTHESGADAA
jgi:signal transduction histidine kinase